MAFFFAIALPAYSQLYFVTGSPTPKYNQAFESVLFKVDADGSVASVRQLVPRNVQTQWVSLSYELKMLVIRTNLDIIALDLTDAAVGKSCPQPATPPGLRSIVARWLLDSPRTGPTFVEDYFTGSGSAFWGITMDPALPCEKSFAPIDSTELRSVVMQGYSGIADIGTREEMRVFSDGGGRLKMRWAGSGETDFGPGLPAGLLAFDTKIETLMFVNNHDLMSIVSKSDLTPSHKEAALVLRKSDMTWHRLTVPTDRFDWQRGFGKFIAVAEARMRGPQKTESAGRSEWRTTVSDMGPSIMDRLNDAPVVFPGRLYLYNVDTEHVYPISTNQGDSEVLLIHRDVVYYRVSNRLYSAPIGTDGLAPAKLLATDEAIRDAHWAFIK
jgi:hypothetical protein